MITKSIADGSQAHGQETDIHLVARPFLESDLGLGLAYPASQHLEGETMQPPLDPYLPDAVLVAATAAAAAVAAASAAVPEACSAALPSCLFSTHLEAISLGSFHETAHTAIATFPTQTRGHSGYT